MGSTERPTEQMVVQASKSIIDVLYFHLKELSPFSTILLFIYINIIFMQFRRPYKRVFIDFNSK